MRLGDRSDRSDRSDRGDRGEALDGRSDVSRDVSARAADGRAINLSSRPSSVPTDSDLDAGEVIKLKVVHFGFNLFCFENFCLFFINHSQAIVLVLSKFKEDIFLFYG